MYATNLESEKKLTLEIKKGRQAYVLCVDGATTLRDVVGDAGVCGTYEIALERHDAAEVVGPITLTMDGPVHLLVVEMMHDARHDGRGDI